MACSLYLLCFLSAFCLFSFSFAIPTSSRIKVLTWNLHLQSEQDNSTWTSRKQTIARTIKNEDADVVALQGFFRNDPRLLNCSADQTCHPIDQFRDLESELGIYNFGALIYVKQKKEGKEFDRGVAILLKWSLSDKGTFTKLGGERPLLFVKAVNNETTAAEHDYQRLFVFTTELTSDQTEQKAMLEKALTWMEPRTNWSSTPTIFMGDFGVLSSDESSMQSLTLTSSASVHYTGDFVDVFEAYQHLPQHNATSATTYDIWRPDRIYIRGNVSVVGYDVLAISQSVADHDPVVAHLMLYTPPQEQNDPVASAPVLPTHPIQPTEDKKILVPTYPVPTNSSSSGVVATPSPEVDPGTLDVSRSVVIITIVFAVLLAVGIVVGIYFFKTRKSNRRGKEYFKPLEFDRFTLTEVSTKEGN